MKLQYLSVLASAMVMAGSAGAAEVYNKDGNKLDLFGKLNGMRYMSSDDAKNGDRSFIHYGFNGEAQLSEGITGFGTWEQEVGLSHAESGGAKSNFTRLGFAGIKFADAGSIDYGRNYGVLYDVGAWTDMMPEFGADTTVTDNFMTGRANGVFTYRNTNFFGMVDGLNFALQYQGKNDTKEDEKGRRGLKGGRGLNEANGDGYGLSVTYDLGNGVSAGAAYTSSNRTLGQRMLNSARNNKDKRAEAYSLGLKYDANNLYLAALYSETRNMTPYGDFSGNKAKHGFADKAHNLELVAQYALDFGLRPSVGYLQSRIDGDYQGKSQTIKKYIEVGASYNFNKNMLAFIDYRINLLSKNDFTRDTQISTDNILAMGMTYMF
ncbi:Outer membrane protein C precursor [Sodalis glossinidius str. 'morsitans']|uniref:Outer membrane protein n=2 Tax=Sodalis glossinidius TaxID=63612 RepID=Q2NSM2_SODGM|nr:porin [Sodalis glossinidius]BAE74853.1 outer membrane protein [Sodalis glossinidius str. 'morsitans']CRL45693.1 Outer membrane protein C precursor [Sodalis glossinidius str. 'morsitans']